MIPLKRRESEFWEEQGKVGPCVSRIDLFQKEDHHGREGKIWGDKKCSKNQTVVIRLHNYRSVLKLRCGRKTIGLRSTCLLKNISQGICVKGYGYKCFHFLYLDPQLDYGHLRDRSQALFIFLCVAFPFLITAFGTE